MYNKKAHIHFVGIGGIGMSGIATILQYQGYRISGCDRDLEQPSIKNLTELGCCVYKGNNGPACADNSIDILVYSSAIQHSNPEIVAAQKRGIPTIPRALMLAELMRTKFSLAIAGSHGKTTTTSLLSHILIEASMDPTIIIGGHLHTISANARYGDGDFLVAEADESDRSLLHLYPTLALVTNIDLEHLETYRDLDDIKNTFKQFLSNLPFYGKAIVCLDDPQIRSLLPITHVKTITYGLTPEADLYGTDVRLEPSQSIFVVHAHNNPTPLGTVTLNMPGIHNIQNALGALALAQDVGVPFATIAQALTSFKGVDRRFTYRGTYKDAEIFDDYGHHPVEIDRTLEVAQRRTKNGLTVVFQPHRYTRTARLWDQFLNTFKQGAIDHLIITDIYPASEAPLDGITSQKLVDELRALNPSCQISYLPFEQDFTQIKAYIDQHICPNDLILLLGAGKINRLAQKLK